MWIQKAMMWGKGFDVVMFLQYTKLLSHRWCRLLLSAHRVNVKSLKEIVTFAVLYNFLDFSFNVTRIILASNYLQLMYPYTV